uniref:Uncharacterized protein n=1 Tax=Arundo donax TaxID=35708 RepID=A0A0A9PMG0_ARUDO
MKSMGRLMRMQWLATMKRRSCSPQTPIQPPKLEQRCLLWHTGDPMVCRLSLLEEIMYMALISFLRSLSQSSFSWL